MCMTFGYNPQINFYAPAIRRMRKGIKRCPCLSVRPFVRASFCASVRPSFKWVLCDRKSSYNFIPILLKLYRCFCQGLKMCMTFGYNPKINFCHIFHSLKIVIFWAQLLLKLMDIRVPCERNSSYNFFPILLKLYRCFCQGLKMCMTFGYKPQNNFCHFCHSLNLVIFGLNYY